MLKPLTLLGMALVISTLWLFACQVSPPVSLPVAITPVPAASLSSDAVITIGDIDPDSPSKKIKRLLPLADYLADHLQDFGIKRGEVVIANDIEGMAKLIDQNRVDIYMDSPFPILQIRELLSTQIIARRWKDDAPQYWSTYVALKESGITNVKDFEGKVIAFEGRHSTSGFILPAGTLIQRGATLSEVDGPGLEIAFEEIGYYFSGDEENTFEALLQGKVAGGGVSNQDYEELPEELKQQIVAFDRTMAVPRQLVSVRPGLPPDMVSKITELLMGLDQTEEGRKLLASLKNTRKFDQPAPELETTLSELNELKGLVAN